MWHRFAREQYAKYKLFENFNQVVEAVKQFIHKSKQLESPSDLVSEFNQSNLAFISKELNLEIRVMARDNSTYDSPLSFLINDNIIMINLDKIRAFNWDESKAPGMLAHELQHAFERHNAYPMQDESGKHKAWLSSAEDSMQGEGIDPDRYHNLTAYYNTPTEVRARLAEILHFYNIPNENEKIRDILGASPSFNDLVEFAKKGLLNIKAWSLMSNEAKNYIIKNLYSSIN